MEHGRSVIPSVSRLLADVDADPRIAIVSLDRAILDVSQTLIGLPEMHDRQIVATAFHLGTGGASLTVLTCDEAIVTSGLVPVVW